MRQQQAQAHSQSHVKPPTPFRHGYNHPHRLSVARVVPNSLSPNRFHSSLVRGDYDYDSHHHIHHSAASAHTNTSAGAYYHQKPHLKSASTSSSPKSTPGTSPVLTSRVASQSPSNSFESASAVASVATADRYRHAHGHVHPHHGVMISRPMGYPPHSQREHYLLSNVSPSSSRQQQQLALLHQERAGASGVTNRIIHSAPSTEDSDSKGNHHEDSNSSRASDSNHDNVSDNEEDEGLPIEGNNPNHPSRSLIYPQEYDLKNNHGNAIPIVRMKYSSDEHEELRMSSSNDSSSKQQNILTLNNNNTNSNSNNDTSNIGCTCKKSKCLKLYCQCFAGKAFCSSDICRCLVCKNTSEFMDERNHAISSILQRNPAAFDNKFKATLITTTTSPHSVVDNLGMVVANGSVRGDVSRGYVDTSSALVSVSHEVSHKLGCKCRKSACLKKYCECYHGNVKCSGNCRCIGCKNMPSSSSGSSPSPSSSQQQQQQVAVSEDVVSIQRHSQKSYVSSGEMDAIQNLAFMKHSSPARKQSMDIVSTSLSPNSTYTEEELPIPKTTTHEYEHDNSQPVIYSVPSLTNSDYSVNKDDDNNSSTITSTTRPRSSSKDAISTLLEAAYAMTELNQSSVTPPNSPPRTNRTNHTSEENFASPLQEHEQDEEIQTSNKVINTQQPLKKRAVHDSIDYYHPHPSTPQAADHDGHPYYHYDQHHPQMHVAKRLRLSSSYDAEVTPYYMSTPMGSTYYQSLSEDENKNKNIVTPLFEAREYAQHPHEIVPRHISNHSWQ
jgi:hypothetical protein